MAVVQKFSRWYPEQSRVGGRIACGPGSGEGMLGGEVHFYLTSEAGL